MTNIFSSYEALKFVSILLDLKLLLEAKFSLKSSPTSFIADSIELFVFIEAASRDKTVN